MSKPLGCDSLVFGGSFDDPVVIGTAIDLIEKSPRVFDDALRKQGGHGHGGVSVQGSQVGLEAMGLAVLV